MWSREELFIRDFNLCRLQLMRHLVQEMKKKWTIRFYCSIKPTVSGKFLQNFWTSQLSYWTRNHIFSGVIPSLLLEGKEQSFALSLLIDPASNTGFFMLRESLIPNNCSVHLSLYLILSNWSFHKSFLFTFYQPNLPLKKLTGMGGRDDSVVKSTGCSCIAPKFSS